MSGLLLAAGALSVAAAAALLAPVLRRRAAGSAEPSETAIYRQQLDELEQDLARGLIAPREAKAARVEIERRLLRAAGRGEQRLASSAGTRGVVIATAVLAPLAAAALYLPMGAPALPDRPFAARSEQNNQQLAIRQMVTRLEERLAREPGGLDDWLMLGRSRSVLGDMQGATDAYRRARALAPDDPRAAGGLAEALTFLAGGMVPREAAALFEEVARRAPGDPQAAFYLGMADAQAGDSEAGKERWRRALAALPASDPARDRLLNAIGGAGRQLGIDVAGVLATPPASAPAGPEALAGMSLEQQLEFVRSMVGRLEARLENEPDDAEGWSRLGQARWLLRQPEKARAAFDKALALAPRDVGILKAYAASLLGPVDPASGLPEVGDEARALFDRAAELRPEDPEPWWFLGIAARQRGEQARARSDWQRLLDLIGPDHPDFAGIRARIEALGS
ncbi:c-type cytochrome biogenesis protein CcmI [Marinimicrococcus flavescens]|uniref:C-type cytochrome biogenesis protein CcmI n=1 Tax=Marinimicrococcus flavescens TaxID=3031815 RepID=A0AAP3UXP1_9PROT|nr:c-type cytochrome biogenesis protein CcmI [Marinimicrococcus flavescens]